MDFKIETLEKSPASVDLKKETWKRFKENNLKDGKIAIYNTFLTYHMFLVLKYYLSLLVGFNEADLLVYVNDRCLLLTLTGPSDLELYNRIVLNLEELPNVAISYDDYRLHQQLL